MYDAPRQEIIVKSRPFGAVAFNVNSNRKTQAAIKRVLRAQKLARYKNPDPIRRDKVGVFVRKNPDKLAKLKVLRRERMRQARLRAIELQHLASVNKRPWTMESLMSRVCWFYRVDLSEMVGTSREARLTLARQTFYVACSNLLGKSTLEIGQFVHRDHSSVHHAIKAHKSRKTKQRAIANKNCKMWRKGCALRGIPYRREK